MGLYADSIRNLRQILPTGLSFFELVVLADALHEQEPDYTALGTQCFWFASTVCQVVEQQYHCTEIVTGPTSPSEISTRPNNYLPDVSGRVGGVLISKPEDLSGMVESFKVHLAEKREQVSYSIFHPECFLLKPRYRYRRIGTVFTRIKPCRKRKKTH